MFIPGMCACVFLLLEEVLKQLPMMARIRTERLQTAELIPELLVRRFQTAVIARFSFSIQCMEAV